MGLFSSVIHIRNAAPDALRSALDAELLDYGLQPRVAVSVPSTGPTGIAEFEALVARHPAYLVSTRGPAWLTVIEASFSVEGTPWISDLSAALAQRLNAYALSLMVHDDDVLYYNLDRGDEALDGYNSCPQYFEKERLPEQEIKSQRHTPEAFAPLLADDEALARLRELLDRGWWRAYDAGQLDEDGIPPGDDNAFPFDTEADRMAQVAQIVGIPADNEPYPYAEWRTSPGIDWPSFEFVAYSKSEEAG
jgi:hypothetical protein